MSPRGSSAAAASSASRNASAPYSRRPASQPKSSRQQFSACGACRMRRVRCDLKDLPFSSTGPHPACSNCKERGIKCVDEFADVKAVKLLRRGRRLQQVEAIYGKTADGSSSSTSPSAARLPSIIPTLQPEFFSSPFWHWFTVQRPILDADEFSSRFFAHSKGSRSLGNEGGLIAMLLVVWASSFGLDERGALEMTDGRDCTSSLDPSTSEGSSADARRDSREALTERTRKERKEKTEAMLREVLELIDFHGVMRRPSLDGVRVLLLLVPLLEDAQPLERLAIHEAVLSHVQALCSLGNPSQDTLSMQTFPNTSDDAAVRARLFWYAHTQEGISTGLRGGRFALNNEDLEAFQKTLPAFNMNAVRHSSPPSPSSAIPPELISSGHYNQDMPPSKYFVQLLNTLSIPLQLSGVCRKVHTVLTGIKASRRTEEHGLIDANGMREIWRDLDHCWQEFDALKLAAFDDRDVRHRLMVEQYVAGWQIFIFECHNIIRESLKQYMSITPTQSLYSASSSRPSSHSSNSSPYLPPQQLHSIAARKCSSLLPYIVRTIKRNLGGSGLFRWDAGLVRDGCFFAGYLAASIQDDTIESSIDDRYFKQETFDEELGPLATEESVAICLSALAEMKWAFSKSEEREETVRMVWENRSLRSRSGHHYENHSSYVLDHRQLDQRHDSSAEYESKTLQHIATSISSSNNTGRPSLPPLALYDSSRRPESAPATSCSVDGSISGGWPSYTPPGTASTTSTGTGISARGSPVFHHLGSFKEHSEDAFYHGAADLDPFSFHAPMTDTVIRGSPAIASVVSFPHRSSPIDPHALASAISPPGYLGGVYNAVGSSVLAHSGGDFHGCPQFGDNCNGSYH